MNATGSEWFRGRYNRKIYCKSARYHGTKESGSCCTDFLRVRRKSAGWTRLIGSAREDRLRQEALFKWRSHLEPRFSGVGLFYMIRDEAISCRDSGGGNTSQSTWAEPGHASSAIREPTPRRSDAVITQSTWPTLRWKLEAQFRLENEAAWAGVRGNQPLLTSACLCKQRLQQVQGHYLHDEMTTVI